VKLNLPPHETPKDDWPDYSVGHRNGRVFAFRQIAAALRERVRREDLICDPVTRGVLLGIADQLDPEEKP